VNVLCDEFPQVGFALHIEVAAHPGEFVRPMPGPFQCIEFDLPAVEERAHHLLLSGCQVEPAMAQLTKPLDQLPAVLLRQIPGGLRQGCQSLLQSPPGFVVIPVVLG